MDLDPVWGRQSRSAMLLSKLEAAGRFTAWRLGGRAAPIALYWKVTHRCTLDCVYCGIPRQRTAELPTDELLDLMTQARRAGTYRVNLSGGEPLLRDDFGRLVRHLRGLGCSVGVDTNGGLVERHLDALRLADQVVISLDGDRAVHDAQRGPGAFDAALSGAERLREAGVGLRLACVVTSGNHDRLDEVLRLARWLGVSATFQPATPDTRDGRGGNPLAPSAAQLRGAFETLRRAPDRRRRVANSEAYFDHLAAYPRLPRMPCPGGRIAAAVTPDGRLGSCDFGVMRNCHRDAIRDGFAAAFRALPRPGPCRHCYCESAVAIQLAMKLDPRALLRTVFRY